MKKIFSALLMAAMMTVALTSTINVAAAYNTIVPLDQVPQFRNDNMGTYPTNGLIADIVRRHVLEMQLNGQDSANGITPEMLQQSRQVLDDILAVWDQDPVTRVFGVNAEGMRHRLSTVIMVPRLDGNGFRGMWYENNTGWFATHDEGIPIDVDEMAHVFLDEIFGRGEGYGRLFAHTKAELFMNTGPSGDPAYWPGYSGFIHAIGGVVGYENMFAALRRSQGNQAYVTAWMNLQIPLLNPHFDFDFATFMRASDTAGAILRHPDLMEVYYMEAGLIDERAVWDYFDYAWDWFYIAINPTASAAERDRAVWHFNRIVQHNANFAATTGAVAKQLSVTYSGFDISEWPHSPSVHAHNQPMFMMPAEHSVLGVLDPLTGLWSNL